MTDRMTLDESLELRAKAVRLTETLNEAKERIAAMTNISPSAERERETLLALLTSGAAGRPVITDRDGTRRWQLEFHRHLYYMTETGRVLIHREWPEVAVKLLGVLCVVVLLGTGPTSIGLGALAGVGLWRLGSAFDKSCRPMRAGEEAGVAGAVRRTLRIIAEELDDDIQRLEEDAREATEDVAALAAGRARALAAASSLLLTKPTRS